MTKTRWVYVVSFGEYGEGKDPESVWSTLAEALAHADKTFGVRPTHHGGVQWFGKVNSTDEVWVRRFSVRGAR